MSYENAPFKDNKDLGRFELKVGDHFAIIDYKEKGNSIHLTHTEVPEALQGQGVADALVERTFRHLQKNNLRMIPLCSYIQVFLRRHPEWRNLVTIS